MKRAEEEIGYLAALALDRANDPRNVRKGDWPESRRQLFWLLMVEVWELGWALAWLSWAYRMAPIVRNARWTIEKARAHVKHEAGDCCNFLAYLVNRL